ncbi:MAG: response regulator [Polyangiaceae bacterium]|nr:response regulator [Polyangiaceae bacterium]
MGRSHEDLAAIVTFADALPVAIWVGRAPSGECVYVNREFERILGIAPPEDAARGNYVGPYGVHLPNGDVYPEDRMPFERVLRSKRTEVIDDLVIHRHDGERTHLRVFAAPLFADDGAIAFVVEAFTDITREVEAERRRAEGERQLQAMRRLESIGSLAGGIAHDFNNLLSIVTLVAGHLRTGEDDASRLAMIEHLEEVAGSASKLTRALLGFARRGKHLSAPVSLHEIVGSVVELARRTFERRLEVVAALDADRDTVLGDGVQLEQVVMNLVMNARDAITAQGRITVRTYVASFAAGEHAIVGPGDYAVLEVEDTGSGIDGTVRDRIFEPYVTTKASGAHKGTGLGLATVYGIARSHGGAAEVATTSTRGTTMRIALPLTSQPLAAREKRAHCGIVKGRGTILVVDDDPLVLRMTVKAVGGLGYEVLSAQGGADAIELFRTSRDRVTAVVLDMIMPGIGGKETYLAMKNIEPTVRVLLTTGWSLNDEAQHILDLGVRGFLSKPFDLAGLSQALARVVAA